jgi:hypothetical protein
VFLELSFSCILSIEEVSRHGAKVAKEEEEGNIEMTALPMQTTLSFAHLAPWREAMFSTTQVNDSATYRANR